MTFRRLVIFTLAALTLVTVHVAPAEACSCMSSGPPCQAFWNATAVFDATVVRIDSVVTDPASVGGLTSRDGRGLANVTVETAPPESLATGNYFYPQFVSKLTEADGHFEFTNLAPGKYVVGVNLRDLPNQRQPYPRILFPGSDAPPQIIELALGQAADLGAWQLPPPLVVVQVSGQIVWKDGTPAVGLYVSVRDVTGSPRDPARGAGGDTSGADGVFAIDVREGREYTFVARSPRNGPFVPLIGPRITAGRGVEPVRLVIQREPPGKEIR